MRSIGCCLLLALLGGCGPIVSRAKFVERPDSVQRGSLLGPFGGQVVDADTQQPIPDALVSCSWAFDHGLGTPAPGGTRSYAARTDVDGRYQIPTLRSFPQGLTSRLARLSFVVYKKEYVAYRQDFIFPQDRQRFDFAQLNNVVKLARWSPELSHAQHLLFVGGGQGLDTAASWEVLPAAAELDRRSGGHLAGEPESATPASHPAPAGPATLDASVLISSDDIRAVTGYTGGFQPGRLAGVRSATYDTFHLRALNQPERYDVAIRIWRPGSANLTARYEKLLNELPGSKQNDELADRSFTVRQGEIMGLGLLDRGSESVVLLTCGRGQCTQESQLLELGRHLEKNLSKLPPPPSSSVPDQEGGTSGPGKPEGDEP